MTDDIKKVTIQSLNNICGILEEVGNSMGKIVKATIFVTDLALFSEVNAAYKAFFKQNPPACSSLGWIQGCGKRLRRVV